MSWRHLEVPLCLPTMTVDHALKKITPKIGDVLEYFMLTSIMRERKILVLLEWNKRAWQLTCSQDYQKAVSYISGGK